MSHPYGPPLETTADWNALLGCCCAMPEAPEPIRLSESVSATRVGWTVPVTDPLDPEYPLKYYLVATETEVNTDVPAVPGETTANYYGTTYTGTISYAFTWSRSFNASPSGAGCAPAAVVTCSGGGAVTQTDTMYTYDSWPLEPPLSGGSGVWNSYVSYTVVRTVTMPTPCVFHTVDVTHQYTLTYEDPHPPYGPASYTVELDDGYPVTTPSDWDRSGYAGSLYPEWFPESALSGQVTRAAWLGFFRTHAAAVLSGENAACKSTAAVASSTAATAVAVRYRWQVPVSHLGTYFKITWDVLYEPVGWDNTSIPEASRPVRFSRKNLTVEWEGPGSGPQSDPSWLAGDWQTLDVPEEPGVRKVINVRFEHTRRVGA